MNDVNLNGTNYINKEKSLKQVALEKIKEAMKPESSMTEEEKKVYENKINRKIRDGNKLTQSEMDYIRRTNPTMYIHIKRVQMKREMLEKKFKHCKSKKEVDEAYRQAISGIGKKDPDKQALISAYDNVTAEFKKSSQYKSLPDEVKKEEKKEKVRKKQIENIVDTRGWDFTEVNLIDIRA